MNIHTNHKGRRVKNTHVARSGIDYDFIHEREIEVRFMLRGRHEAIIYIRSGDTKTSSINPLFMQQNIKVL